VATTRERRREGFHVTVGGDSKPVKLTAEGVKEFRNDNETSKFERGDAAGHHAAVQGAQPQVPSCRRLPAPAAACRPGRRCHRVTKDQVHHPPGQEIRMLASISSDAAFLYNSSRIRSSSFPMSNSFFFFSHELVDARA
jgi:hypothetical protein